MYIDDSEWNKVIHYSELLFSVRSVNFDILVELPHQVSQITEFGVCCWEHQGLLYRPLINIDIYFVSSGFGTSPKRSYISV